jgi:hypothetical protein
MLSPHSHPGLYADARLCWTAKTTPTRRIPGWGDEPCSPYQKLAFTSHDMGTGAIVALHGSYNVPTTSTESWSAEKGDKNPRYDLRTFLKVTTHFLVLGRADDSPEWGWEAYGHLSVPKQQALTAL